MPDLERITVDMAVIGSGPAGQKAAIQAAKLGKSAVVIDKDVHPGGVCLNSGTIPSKSLREAILDLTDFHQRTFYGQQYKMRSVSMADLNFRLSQVLAQERELILRQFRKNDIRLLHGFARFKDKHILEVVDENQKPLYEITASVFIIATGSRPRNPIQVPFDDEVILDSTRLLKIDEVPESMIVLGGGIIGAEYASFVAALGTRVTVIDKREQMLPLLDSEIGLHFQQALSQIGLSFIGNKMPQEVRRVDNHAEVTFSDGSKMTADVLLYALGREACVQGMNLDVIGVQLNQSGYIPVNALFQTERRNVYAVGDVIGSPALASTSMEQGRLAALNAFGMKTHHFPDVFPLGIYTIPEISSCGYTEEQLKTMGYRYEVGRAYYHEIARGHIAGSTRGLFKILFHAETLEILGVHIIGRSATEVIHIGQVAMSFNAHIDYFISQVFNYPTFAEGYRIAALNGYNKVRHLRESH